MDHAQKRTDRELTAGLDPGFELVPGPAIHSYLAAFTSLASTDEDRAAGSVEVAFLKRERFIDPEPGTPEQDDQGAEAVAVGAVTDGSHDGHDLLDATAVELNEKAACRAVVATALNPKARTWWERLGFRPFDPTNPDRLDLYLLTAEIETALRNAQ